MRTFIGFSTLLLVVCLGLFPVASSEATQKDIVDTAVGAGQFETLVAAVKAARLVEALKSDGPFTVFAPTDAAFAKLPEGTIESLLERKNRGKLAAILKYHVIPGRVSAREAINLRRGTTLNGQQLDLRFEDGQLTVDGARVIQADIGCANGVIHVIDRVMLPSSDDIVAAATKAGSFKTLAAALKAAGLVEALQGDGPFTVFAPTDDAFAKLPRGTVESLLEPGNRARLQAILKYHVIPGRLTASQALEAGSARTLQGESLQLRLSDGGLKVNDAGIVSIDLDTSNGVIHVIDSVLIPDKLPATQPQGRKLIGIGYAHPSSKQRERLGLPRGEGIVITSVSRGRGARGAGLRGQDVIVRIDGGPATLENLKRAKERAGVGGTVKLTVVRDYEVPVSLQRH